MIIPRYIEILRIFLAISVEFLIPFLVVAEEAVDEVAGLLNQEDLIFDIT